MEDCILIVEDEKDLLHGLKRMITTEIKSEVLTAANASEAIKIIRHNSIDLLLSDIRMPDMDGLTLLREVKKIDPAITVIMMTAFGSIELAVQSIKDGAYDFIRKPLEEKKLFHLLRKGLERNRLVRENARLMKRVREKTPFHHMIGQSEAMQKVFRTIQTLALTDITVLLLGQSGTGKEMAARAIHDLSNRRHRDLVTVNCPALPENILESELFGYRKGAFTNAAADRIGLFETAHRGTIFLDEIGDLSPTLQTKLLRAIQEKEIKPLGDNQTRHVDVRIIASTNQDLSKKIADGTFREDLYYRIKVATIIMPPLDERKEDLPLLVDHFLSKIAGEVDVEKKQITTEVLNKLFDKSWPGNVRELENTIREWYSIIPAQLISKQDLGIDRQNHKNDLITQDIFKPYKQLKAKVIEMFTRKYLHQLLTHTEGNVTLAAEISRIKRQSLQKIIKRYSMSASQFRQ